MNSSTGPGSVTKHKVAYVRVDLRHTGLVVELVGLLILARRVLLDGLLYHIDGTAQEVGVTHVGGCMVQ